MHTDHTQLAYYMKVAKVSDRIAIETTGYTFENRLTIVNHFKSLKLGSY
jgi:hypothetical protein